MSGDKFDYTELVNNLRTSFNSGKTLPLKYRKEQLEKLKQLITENEEKLCQALHQDLNRSKPEAMVFEVTFTMNELNTAISELDRWASNQKVSKTLLQLLDRAYIAKDPLGVVLIISPWNYPIQLLLCPLIGAIAAGNAVVMKPSELCEQTSALIGELVPKYLDPEIVQVVLGAVPETTALLKQQFDHIFYTGAPSVGKIVMRAAAEFLTPVTLELGGKSPAIIDCDCDLTIVARRLAWGKFVNCGQTCVAPDYLLLTDPEQKPKLLEQIQIALKEFYGDDPQQSPEYGRIINDRHFKRLTELMTNSKAKVAIGGQSDSASRFIAPTVFEDVRPDDSLMQDELFGPLLPMVVVDGFASAVHLIKQGPKPLVIYVFSNTQSNIDLVVRRTSSGAVTVNDCLLHMCLDTLPFGGVGQSGMGRYHGKFSFDTFTHEKAVLHRGLSGEKLLWMRYPPFDERKEYWGNLVATKRKVPFL